MAQYSGKTWAAGEVITASDMNALDAAAAWGTKNPAQLINISSGSQSATVSAADRPRFIMAFVVTSGVFSDAVTLPFGALAGASYTCDSYTVSVNAQQTSVTITKNSGAPSGSTVRAWAMY